MDKVLTPIVTSVSDFRSDMPGTLRRAKREPFAVLSNNKPSFYVLSPEHYELITELLIKFLCNVFMIIPINWQCKLILHSMFLF